MPEPAQPETASAQPQRTAEPAREATPPALAAPAAAPLGPMRGGAFMPSSPAAVMALQQGAGNAAVSRLLAGGRRPTTLARQPEEPPQLPISGDANIALLENERIWNLDLPELDDIDIGTGKLSTGPIEIAEGVEAELEVGAHNPPRLADASVKLSPVVANISAAAIAERRKVREGATTAYGIGGAIAGGVLGGLAGASPVGLLSGLNPISGAEQGGALGGKLAEEAAGWGVDRFSLQAVLTAGVLTGHLRLVYNPYIRLRLGLSLLSKLFNVDATLQTQLGLSLMPQFAVVGSKVGLHFEKGKLTRSEFSLDLEAAMEAALEAAGMLSVNATVLSIIDGSENDKRKAHDDPGLLKFNLLSTDVFPILEDFRGRFAARTKLDLLKASPLDIVKKSIEPTDDEAVTNHVAKGMKGELSKAISKRSGKKGAADPDDPNAAGGRRFHKGTFQDPIPIIWYKPPHIYPDYLDHGHEDAVAKFPHRTYADGLEAGVDAEWWPWVGKKFKKQAGKRAAGGVTTGQADLKEAFEEHGVTYHGDIAQIDHVFDDALGGPDDAENLWPLKTKDNLDAGLKHGHQGVRYWPPDGPEPTLPTAVSGVPAGAWFVITREAEPGDALPPEPPGAPEKE